MFEIPYEKDQEDPDVAPVWEVTDPEILSFTDSGSSLTVTPLAAGTTKLTCKLHNGREYAIEVQISEISKADLEYAGIWKFRLSEAELTMQAGEITGLGIVLTDPENPYENRVDQGEAFSWYSSDSEVVKVRNGKLTACKAGTAVIVCRGTNKGELACCIVTVEE